MRKNLITMFFCLFLVSFVSAEKGRISIKPWKGYSYVNMRDFNNYVNEKVKCYEDNGYKYITYCGFEKGPIMGIDVQYFLNKNI